MTKKVNQKKVAEGVRLILEGINADATDRNYRDTPGRVARMYHEMFSPPRNTLTAFDESHGNMVILRGHRVFGMCPHHLLPVEMRVSLAYIPDGRVLGLSKLCRAIDEHLTAPVMQETLTDAIAISLHKRLRPLGVGVVIVGQHGCMRYRGVRTDADVITSSVTGVFRDVASARDEFLRLVGGPK